MPTWTGVGEYTVYKRGKNNGIGTKAKRKSETKELERKQKQQEIKDKKNGPRGVTQSKDKRSKARYASENKREEAEGRRT